MMDLKRPKPLALLRACYQDHPSGPALKLLYPYAPFANFGVGGSVQQTFKGHAAYDH